ncbi:hypothetical protein IMSAG049_00179 [Clostridiales bacterium]|nr:hypothetical protein IMSAG049_00179 [Clostridiales bacterium]
MKMKKLLIILIVAVFFTPPAAILRSMAVMSVYSAIHQKDSIPAKEGFKIKIPGGLKTLKRDWYPFVMTFNDNKGFQNFCGDDGLSLTILYNFPAFSLFKGCSYLFDPSSPYCSSFYGAYIVHDLDGAYGFNSDGSIDYSVVSQVPEFDMAYLVLSDFGLSNMIFDWRIENFYDNISYIEYNGWSQFDIAMEVSSAVHNPDGFSISYLQYGFPNFKTDKNFEPLDMYGRIYVRYFEEYSSSVFFYIIAADKQVLDNCDSEILSQSKIVKIPKRRVQSFQVSETRR